MKRLLKWILSLVVVGLIILAFFYNKKESKNLIVVENNISKPQLKPIEVKKETLFKEVKRLGRLEFFKMYAVEKKKILMVHFSSDGCYYCTKMKETLSNSRIQEALAKNYIVVTINYSRYKREFQKVYHLRATPATFFFDKEGKMMKNESFYGYRSVEDFFTKIEGLVK